jgi:hypothetical protein
MIIVLTILIIFVGIVTGIRNATYDDEHKNNNLNK